MATRGERWLLELMADRARRLLDPSIVLVILEADRELQVAAASPDRAAGARVVPIEGSALGAIYSAGEPVAFERPLGAQADWLRELGLDAGPALIQPLATGGANGGMLIALRRDQSFRDADMSAFAAVAANLTQRLAAERIAEQERLRYGVVQRERERARWARELHDETVQGLGALRLALANARDSGDPQKLVAAADQAIEALDREVISIRHLITELRPAALDDLGLQAALEALARRAQDVYSLDVTLDLKLPSGDAGERLDGELETTVYRIIQEALSNASRHANATAAAVRLFSREGELVVEISDNGAGIEDPGRLLQGAREAGQSPRRKASAGADAEAGAERRYGGYGLPGMRERAELVGGRLTLESTLGAGTTVRLSVPLEPRRA
jgi:signal transduction histidine kinase